MAAAGVEADEQEEAGMKPEHILQIEARHKRDSAADVFQVTESTLAQMHLDRRDLLEEVGRLREVIREIEWISCDSRCDGMCPSCGFSRDSGHEEGCALDGAIQGSGDL